MLIGLTGYAQSGKDTLAQILVDDYGFVRVAFADKIRNFAYALNPIVKPGLRLQDAVEEMGWDKAKTRIPEVRRILQDLGVGGRTLFGDDFWIREAFSDARHSQKIVVTDVRFKNEADWIKNFEDSHIWRVKRSGVGAVNAHVSETEMDEYKADQIFANNGTIEDLRELLKRRMNDF